MKRFEVFSLQTHIYDISTDDLMNSKKVNSKHINPLKVIKAWLLLGNNVSKSYFLKVWEQKGLILATKTSIRLLNNRVSCLGAFQNILT